MEIELKAIQKARNRVSDKSLRCILDFERIGHCTRVNICGQHVCRHCFSGKNLSQEATNVGNICRIRRNTRVYKFFQHSSPRPQDYGWDRNFNLFKSRIFINLPRQESAKK